MKKILSLFLITGGMLVSSVTYASVLNNNIGDDKFSGVDAAVPTDTTFGITGNFVRWTRNNVVGNATPQKVQALGNGHYETVIRFEKDNTFTITRNSLGVSNFNDKIANGNFVKGAYESEFKCVNPGTYKISFSEKPENSTVNIDSITKMPSYNVTFNLKNKNIKYKEFGMYIFNENKKDMFTKYGKEHFMDNAIDKYSYTFDFAQYVHYDYKYAQFIFRETGDTLCKTNIFDFSLINSVMDDYDVTYNIDNQSQKINGGGFDFVRNTNNVKPTARFWLNKGNKFPYGTFPLLNINDNTGKTVDIVPVKEYLYEEFGKKNVCYFDVDANLISKDYSYVLKEHKSETGDFTNNTTSFDFNTIDVTKMHYIWDDNTVHTGLAGDINAQISMATLTKVFENIQTCSTNTLYGYPTYKGLYESFIGNNHEFISDFDTSDPAIKDYATADDYLTGNKTFETTLKTKLDTMARLSSNHDNKLANMIFNNEDNVLVISITSLLILLAIIPSVILILKKRKYLVK